MSWFSARPAAVLLLGLTSACNVPLVTFEPLSDGRGSGGCKTASSSQIPLSQNLQSVDIGLVNDDSNNDIIITAGSGGANALYYWPSGGGLAVYGTAGDGNAVITDHFGIRAIAYIAQGMVRFLIAQNALLVDGGSQALVANALPARSIATGSIDSDGYGDLVVASPRGLSALSSTGGPPYTSVFHTTALVDPIHCELGDFDGDQVPDAVCLNGTGLTDFVLGTNLVRTPIAGDIVAFTLGGRAGQAAELIAARASGSVVKARGGGEDELFKSENQILLLATGDFDGDGIRDVVAATTLGLEVRFGLTTGFSDPFTLSLDGAQPTAIAVGDLNNDGRTDIAVTRDDSSVVRYLLCE